MNNCFSSVSLLALMLPFLCVTGLAQTPSPGPATAVTITIEPGARQRFAGLGASCGNWGNDYQKLTTVEREQLSSLVWSDLKMRSLRLWINLNEYAPTPGTRKLDDFRKRYIDSGIVADAERHGVTDLLLAPDNVPAYMKIKRAGGSEDYALRDESLDDYATLIATFLQQVRDETGVLINVTGIQNEPNNLDRVSPEQMPRIVKVLRRALDDRGLQAVKVIAPESANVDGTFYQSLDALQADPAAWNALSGIASHSYSMAATDRAARYAARENGSNSKEYWMTEASANGPEAPNDALRGASLAARFLSDMNHRVTHWIHFIGFEIPDAKDDATRIVAYSTQPLRTVVFQKYHYYRQLMTVFDVGATFRCARSSLEDGMTWTYGKKSRVTAAAACNPDGSWGIGVVNFTAAATSFNDDPKDGVGSENGYYSRTFDVTVRIPELSHSGDMPCVIRRTNDHFSDASEEPIAMHDGEITLHGLGPLDLVTVRTVPPGK